MTFVVLTGKFLDPHTIRLLTHLNVSREDIAQAARAFREVIETVQAR